jgi:hypothetical protein
MVDSVTLEKLLGPIVQQLQGINQSLAILADLQLAAEFTPETDSRRNIYRQMDQARKLDSLAADEIEHATAKRRVEGGKDDKSVGEGISEAVKARQQTLQAIQNLNDLFPAMGRLHKLVMPVERR